MGLPCIVRLSPCAHFRSHHPRQPAQEPRAVYASVLLLLATKRANFTQETLALLPSTRFIRGQAQVLRAAQVNKQCNEALSLLPQHPTRASHFHSRSTLPRPSPICTARTASICSPLSNSSLYSLSTASAAAVILLQAPREAFPEATFQSATALLPAARSTRPLACNTSTVLQGCAVYKHATLLQSAR